MCATYFIASLPHQGGCAAQGKGICQQERNPLIANPVLRALLVAMDEWVTQRHRAAGKPRAARRPTARWCRRCRKPGQGFPKIEGVNYNGRMHTGDLFDFGPDFAKGILTVLPPKHRRHALSGAGAQDRRRRQRHRRHPPAGRRGADRDLYGLGVCARSPPAAMTAATAPASRSTSPRPRPSAIADGDPRPSLEERYASHDAYVNAVTAAAQNLARERLFLDEDVQAYIRKAQASPVGR